jgi:hypothetical protein
MPPFKQHGEGGAEFYCLSHVPVKYRQRKVYVPAELGLYFCGHKAFTRFSRHCFAVDQRRLSYQRGDDWHDNLSFVLMSALLDAGVHPSMWRLYPHTEVPKTEDFREYELARRELCRILFRFRCKEMAARLTANMTSGALMMPADDVPRIGIGDYPEEDAESERALIENG